MLKENVKILKKQKGENKQRIWYWFFIILCIVSILTFIGFVALGDFYMNWDYDNPKLATLGTVLHAFIWIFVRLMPFILIGSVLGIYLTRKRK